MFNKWLGTILLGLFWANWYLAQNDTYNRYGGKWNHLYLRQISPDYPIPHPYLPTRTPEVPIISDVKNRKFYSCPFTISPNQYAIWYSDKPNLSSLFFTAWVSWLRRMWSILESKLSYTIHVWARFLRYIGSLVYKMFFGHKPFFRWHRSDGHGFRRWRWLTKYVQSVSSWREAQLADDLG